MIVIRHIGIYVNDITMLEQFYCNVFRMHSICSMQKESSPLFDELLSVSNSEIMTTKLITPYGKAQGQGDMLELVKVLSGAEIAPNTLLQSNHPIYHFGTAHIAFETEDIFNTIENILVNNGSRKTNIATMPNGNLCCFATDPEGNWIELIQRSQSMANNISP